ncbi:MAG: rod shape-determining protein MreC [Candidatus Magasanikbacteria bacterium RIFOXYD2_FULL_41_14]|uniref:Cell shape-determining protein MreC n=1 Tax=Candidatus Magasanikbacteria bacterium RIFOXYD2_FULL_41_14 TaxID=1798709 RepID=A0A1F6PBU9_9BACT|nr:MAG: rod shape-determining protein MreC [Candidatus Magasanikbacteria bacterium RIFOXYD2_FULL_41_14]
MAKRIIQRRYWVALIFLAFVFLFHFLGWLKPVESFISNLFSPLVTKIYKLDIDPPLVESKSVIYTKYQNCLADKQDTEYWQAQAQILTTENQEFEKQLQFKKNQKYSMLAASVIGRSLDTNDQSLLLDIGQQDGVAVGQPVVVGAGAFIGKITEVGDRTSWVRLLSDSRSKIAGSILNSDQSIGVIEGGYGLSVKMNFIPRNETVNIGDLITTSGLEDGVPRGLVIGKIAALENEAYKPFQQAIITPTANLDKIFLINVIINVD